MGMEVAAFVLGGLSVAATVGKVDYQEKAAREKKLALEREGKQMQLETQQKTLANYDLMEKTLAAQEAHMSTTGLSFSSPSFNAVERNTLNIGARKEKNLEIEGQLEQENIATEKRNVKNTLHAQLFGDVEDVASNAASLFTKIPSKG